ncbi:MAG: type II toxin-antitoxin system Phd/YefM family antitoxin [Gemmatimonadetes bacterium]|nr:type II toxin-antitoxin system Phd/YefM family antitoxin [Gemmatimonadota bacterium]
MADIRPGKDVQTLSAFRANAAGMIDHVRRSRRPLIITQNGRSAAVVLDVEQYDALLDELDVVRDVRESLAQLERGEGVPHGEAMARLRARVRE